MTPLTWVHCAEFGLFVANGSVFGEVPDTIVVHYIGLVPSSGFGLETFQ